MNYLKRKVVRWEEVQHEPEYIAVLECGHSDRSGEYTSANQKALIEADGNETYCYECSRKAERVAYLEQQLAEEKAR